MTAFDWVAQILGIFAALLAAPLFLGWVNQCRAWLQNKSAPPLLLPYRAIRKLFHKDAVIASNASPLFRLAPYVVFGTMVTAAAIIPSIATRLPFTRAADAIVLVGLFATARVFVSLAAMDVGTAFGTLGARREMMIGFLAEPALLMVIFVASLIGATTALPQISELLATQSLALYPSLAFTAVAFTMVLLAENARIPVDNPATHLELTMIHEALPGVLGAPSGADGMGRRTEALQLRLHRLRTVHPVGAGHEPGTIHPHSLVTVPWSKARAGRRRYRSDRNGVGQAARVPGAGVSCHCIPVRRPRTAGAAVTGSVKVEALPFDLQLLNALAALLLLISFAMLSQRRIVTLVNLLAMQGALLCIATILLAWRTGAGHLYFSAGLTLALKVIFLPWLLHRLMRRLGVYWDPEPLLNTTGTMLIGVLVVVFSFGLAQPISALASTATRNAIGIAVAVVLIAFMTMITRRKAMSQVVGFLSMENGLFFGAMSATYGMPMIVELGVALDVLVAMLVLGVFFFQIREQFDSLDLSHLESLKEDQ